MLSSDSDRHFSSISNEILSALLQAFSMYELEQETRSGNYRYAKKPEVTVDEEV